MNFGAKAASSGIDSQSIFSDAGVLGGKNSKLIVGCATGLNAFIFARFSFIKLYDREKT